MVATEGYMMQCSWCRKVLRPGGDPKCQEDWQQVDPKIIERHTMSHGVCPSCTEDMWEEDKKAR